MVQDHFLESLQGSTGLPIIEERGTSLEWQSSTFAQLTADELPCSMSLGGAKNNAINDAVAAAVRSGLVVVVAAGNSNQDACLVRDNCVLSHPFQYSPASEITAITVAASAVGNEQGEVFLQKPNLISIKDIDERAYYSNWGLCVDMIAPGSLITAAWIGAPDAVQVCFTELQC